MTNSQDSQDLKKSHFFRHDRHALIIETLVLALFLVSTLAWRIFLIQRETINPDEMFLVGGAYRVHSGMLPYLDYIDVHAPLIYKIYAPLIGLIGERPDFVDIFRWINWFLMVAFCIVMFLLIKRAFNGILALWSLCILNSFVFFIESTVHARPDALALVIFLLSLFLLISRNKNGDSTWRRILSFIGFGLATSLHITIAFPTAAVLIWLLIENWGRGSRLQAFKTAFFCGMASVIAYVLSCAIVFGHRLSAALIMYPKMFKFDRLYQSLAEYNTLQIFKTILSNSPLPWILIGCAVLISNVKWLTRGLKNSHAKLFTLLTDMGVAFLLVHEDFEQYYFSLVIFGSILAALMLKEWTRNLQSRFHHTPKGVFDLSIALVLTLSSLATCANFQIQMEKKDSFARKRLSNMQMPALQADGSWAPSDIKKWMAQQAPSFDPFNYRPKEQRIAQIQFMLEHSKPNDVVFSDWLNPPYRNLPAPIHHGYPISLFYKSRKLRNNPKMVELLHHYDPYYSIDDQSETEHMIRLFEKTQPTLLLLDGSLGQLFFSDDIFQKWITDRYRLIIEPKSSSVFAILRSHSEPIKVQ